MDITSTFRTAVQRYQNSEKLALQHGEKDAKLLSRKPALWKERKGKQSSFSKAALQIFSSIDNVLEFLKNHDPVLLDSRRHLYSERNVGIKSIEKDNIDIQLGETIKKIAKQIESLSKIKDDLKDQSNINNLSHMEGIISHLCQKFQYVTQIYSEHKSFHFKQAEEGVDGYLKLSPLKLNRKHSKSEQFLVDLHHDEVSHVEGLSLSENETHLLEEENQQLAKQLECTVDQTRDIEKQVMEISELMHIFSAKVSEQTQQIEGLHSSAINTRLHVDGATKELRKAAEHSVDFRVFVLLFLIISSVALLFLHWIT